MNKLSWKSDAFGYSFYLPVELVKKHSSLKGMPHLIEHLYHHSLAVFSRQMQGMEALTNGATDDVTLSANITSLSPLHFSDTGFLTGNINEDVFLKEKNIVLREISEKESIQSILKDEVLKTHIDGYRSQETIGSIEDVSSISWKQVKTVLERLRKHIKIISFEPETKKDSKNELTKGGSLEIQYHSKDMTIAGHKIYCLSLEFQGNSPASYLYSSLIESVIRNCRDKGLTGLVRDQFQTSYGVHTEKVLLEGRIIIIAYFFYDSLQNRQKAVICNRIKELSNLSTEDISKMTQKLLLENHCYTNLFDLLNYSPTMHELYGGSALSALFNALKLEKLLDIFSKMNLQIQPGKINE